MLIHEHHPAYLCFEQFLANQARMQGNSMMRNVERPQASGAAREGAGLLQGLALCAHCGRKMHLSYGGHRSQRVYQYRCSRARSQHPGPDCQLIGGKRIDQTVVEAFLEYPSGGRHLPWESVNRKNQAGFH